jgi:hypothetical protein
MSFTVDDFHDLVRIMEQQPEWREEMRRLLLTRDLLELPEVVRRIAAAQEQTAAQLAELVAAQQRATEELAELRATTERRFEAVEGQIGTLADEVTQLRTTTDRRFESVEHQISTLVEVQQRMAVDVGELKGWGLELKYERHAGAYFGRIIRRTHVLSLDERWDLLDAGINRGQLSDAEADEIIAADLVIRGRRRDQTEVYLVVEVSWGIGHEDVSRARERAALLRKTGVEALPVVAGDWASAEVQEDIRVSQVWLVTDGRVSDPSTN